MKRILLLLTTVAFMASVSSCAKCITCRKGDQKQKLCDKDWDGADQKAGIDYYEAGGWDCKKATDSY